MQFAMDARLILPQMTGIGRYLMGLISGMRSVCHTDQGQIWLQRDLPDDHPVWQMDGGPLSLKRLPVRHMDWRAQWVLPQWTHKESPDLVHYPHIDLPWFTPGKFVLTIHDLKYISQPGFFRRAGWAKHLLMKTMMHHAAKHAQAVLTDSQFTANDLTKRLKVDPHKIYTIPLGVDEQFFRKLTDQDLNLVRRKYRLPEKYLLTVGERRPHKNLCGLIRAFALFQKTAKRAYQLVIAGKPYAEYQEPQILVEELRLGDCVFFLDYVEETDLPALYQMASIFLLLSYYEGFGLPILEAMASGVPVIASNCSALPEVVGEHGLLVDPGDAEATVDALHTILTSDSLRNELTQNAITWAQTFTWQSCAAQTLELYHQVLKT
ncbi:MAG TPA: glycosyltransferase family 1 protein [Anaerolineales bacterium]|nr:glycosyltransferase family 1 protein [Anaerolineales bacterium]